MAGAEVPWVLELKVPAGGTGNGYGAYLRKGIAQAVLYRHFIRTARPLHPWLSAGGMSAEVAHAALVFPAISDRHVAHKVAQRLDAHRAVAEEFDVAVLTVPAGPPIPADDRWDR